MSETVSEAVILMAGSGSRLRDHGENRFKPTLPLLGRPLISYTFDALTNAGIKKVNVVLGFEADALRKALEEEPDGGCREEIEYALGRLKCRDCVVAIVSAEDTDKCKPDPEGYRLAFEALRTHGKARQNGHAAPAQFVRAASSVRIVCSACQ